MSIESALIVFGGCLCFSTLYYFFAQIAIKALDVVLQRRKDVGKPVHPCIVSGIGYAVVMCVALPFFVGAVSVLMALCQMAHMAFILAVVAANLLLAGMCIGSKWM